MEVKYVSLEPPMVSIPLERFEALLTAEVKLNMLKDLCDNEKYVFESDIRRIVGMGGKKDVN